MPGLDQESGYPFDDKPYFGELLLKAVRGGEVSEARLTRWRGASCARCSPRA